MQPNSAGLAADLDLSRLPSSPQVVTRLLQALEQERPSATVLAQLVACDPAICLRVLSAAGATGHLLHAPPSVESTVAAAGSDLLRAITISAAAPHSAYARFDFDAFWAFAMLNGELCRSLAREIAYRDSDEAYLCGLLHNIGQVALLFAAPAGYERVLAASRESELHQAEQTALGFTHADLSGDLVDRWESAAFVGDAIRYHHHPVAACVGSQLLVRIVRVAVALSSGEGDSRYQPGATLLNLAQSVLERIRSDSIARVKQVADELNIPFGKDEAGEPEVQPQGVLKLMEEIPDGHQSSDRRDVQLLASLHDSAMKHALAQVFSHCRNEADVLAATQRTAAGLLGLAAPLFFLPELNSTVLRGRCGSRGCEAVEDLELALDPGTSVVVSAYSEGRMVSTRDHQPLNVLDRQILRLARSDGILCIPLFSGGKAAGVMIAVGTDEARLTAGGMLVAMARLAGDGLDRTRRTGGEDASQRELAELYRTHARRMIHEAGNPLGIIKNYLKVLALRLGTENSVQQELSILNEEIDRVTHIIRRFGEPPTASRRADGVVDVNDVLKEMITAYGETLFGTRRIGVELALDPGVPPIKTEEDGVKQALLNLFKNAAEAMSAGGKFVVATSDNINHDGKTYIEIRLKDNGPGIIPELMQHLYQPVASTKGEGHEGLGLSIVLSVVQRLGGTIMCRSQVGQGTVFQLLLPRNTD